MLKRNEFIFIVTFLLLSSFVSALVCDSSSKICDGDNFTIEVEKSVYTEPKGWICYNVLNKNIASAIKSNEEISINDKSKGDEISLKKINPISIKSKIDGLDKITNKILEKSKDNIFEESYYNQTICNYYNLPLGSKAKFNISIGDDVLDPYIDIPTGYNQTSPAICPTGTSLYSGSSYSLTSNTAWTLFKTIDADNKYINSLSYLAKTTDLYSGHQWVRFSIYYTDGSASTNINRGYIYNTYTNFTYTNIYLNKPVDNIKFYWLRDEDNDLSVNSFNVASYCRNDFYNESYTFDIYGNTTVSLNFSDGCDYEENVNVYFENDTKLTGINNFTLVYNESSFIIESNASNCSWIYFYRSNYERVETQLIVNIYNRETGTLLNDSESTVNLFGYFSDTTTNGTYEFSNTSIIDGFYILQVLSNGYGTEQKTINISGDEVATVNFYLLNLTGDNTGYLFVNNKDIFGRYVVGADDVLLEYDSDSLAYLDVSQCVSNSNGECQFLIELNEKTYMVSGSKIQDSLTLFDILEPEILTTDNEVRNLILSAQLTGESTIIDGVDLYSDETVSNWNLSNTSKVVAYFDVLSGSSREFCISYYANDIEIYLNCVNSSTGILTSETQSLNRSLDYRVEVYLLSGSTAYVYDTYYYNSAGSFEFLMNEDHYAEPFILISWIAIISIGLYFQNVSLACLLGMILPFVELFIFPNRLILSVSVIKFLICWGMATLSRKKESVN